MKLCVNSCKITIISCEHVFPVSTIVFENAHVSCYSNQCLCVFSALSRVFLEDYVYVYVFVNNPLSSCNMYFYLRIQCYHRWFVRVVSFEWRDGQFVKEDSGVGKGQHK